MFKHVMNSILITLGITLLFGIAGFIVGKIQFSTGNIDCCFPYQILDKKSFKIVGTIHNYGYTGGEIGALVGIAYQIIKREAIA